MNNINALVRPEILAMTPYPSARSTAGADGILLNANEAPFVLVDQPGWSNLNRYPVPQPAELKDRLSDIYRVSGEQLLVTRGSDEGIDLLLRVFCRPSQDAIIECPPCFGMYRIAANIQGAAIIEVPRDPQRGLNIDFDRLCRTISDREDARLVFLTTPNNPTGDVIDRVDLEPVLQACGEHALLILDEAYIEFCGSESAVDLLDQWPNLVVLRTLSKAWGAAGLRCGSVIAQPEIIELLQRVMAPYPLSVPAVAAAMTITSAEVRANQGEMLAGISTSKTALIEFLESCRWVEEIWPGEANFVLLRVDNEASLVQYCADQNIRIRDFSTQALLERCVRVSIGSEDEMATLKSVLSKYGKQDGDGI